MTLERTWTDDSVTKDLAQLRATSPLTHCLTNLVVTGFTANVLLAVGASPAMVIAAEEVEDFAAVAEGLLVNVGTVTSADTDAMNRAARAARAARTPWVLDPVAVGPRLLEHGPSIIRGNASEILALVGSSGGGRGADSTSDSREAIEGARELATRTGAVVAVSGAVDYITDGEEVVGVPGGHVLLTKVTGSGCALGAVMAAFLGVSHAPLDAAIGASAVFAAAGERAAAKAQGPGGLAVGLLDELYRLGRPELVA